MKVSVRAGMIGFDNTLSFCSYSSSRTMRRIDLGYPAVSADTCGHTDTPGWGLGLTSLPGCRLETLGWPGGSVQTCFVTCFSLSFL